MSTNNIPDGPNASDNGACVQPASGEVAVGAAAQLDAMVTAYLEANDAYWRKTDKLPLRPGEWRAGTAREATRVSLLAAIAAAPASPQAPAPQAVVGEATINLIDAIIDNVLSGYVHVYASNRYKPFQGCSVEQDMGVNVPRSLKEAIRAALTPSPAPSAAPHQGADALREASEREAFDLWMDRTVDHDILGNAISQRKAAHPAYAMGLEAGWMARAALAHHQAPQQGEQHV
jgi:hypothetical protein